MTDFSNGKVYKIVCRNTNLCYIGSTTQTLKQRLSNHISKFKANVKNLSSFKVLAEGNYVIELITDVPCTSKYELETVERYYIELNDCVNLCIPNQTQAEYRNQNKKKILERKAEYRKQNMAKLKETHNCKCGGRYTIPHKALHFKTKKHLDYMKNSS